LLPLLVEEVEDVDGDELGEESFDGDEESFDGDDEDEASFDDESLLFAEPFAPARLSVR
jgi:hypothetical protein